MAYSILDFARLLSPISSENPCGIDLREDPTTEYYLLRDMRSKTRHMERQQISTQSNWSAIYQMANQLLMTQTKDLEITTWLIEALLREQGFAGLYEGFALARYFIEQFWESLYPLPDEDGIIARIVAFSGLNGEVVEGTLIAPIALVPLIKGSATENFSLWHYHQAMELSTINDVDKCEQRIAEGVPTLDKLFSAAHQIPNDYFAQLKADLQLCMEEYQRLVQVLSEKCGEDAPSSSRIVNQLVACQECVQILAKQAKPIASRPQLAADVAQAVTAASETNEIVESNTRQHMLQNLAHIADYFRHTEPHSPIPYLLERTLRWGNMSLSELLDEWVTEETTRSQLYRLIGIGDSGYKPA